MKQLTLRRKAINLMLTLALVMAFGAIMGMMPGLTQTAHAATSAKYVDANGVEKTASNCTVVTSSTTGQWQPGWYVVNSDVTLSNKVSIVDDVHLILADGKTLTGTITQLWTQEHQNPHLHIYGQKSGTGTLIPTDEYYGMYFDGAVTINGGIVKATGDSAGFNAVKPLTINGGTVTATGTRVGNFHTIGGSGIYGSVVVNGGTLTASGKGATPSTKAGVAINGNLTVANGLTIMEGDNENNASTVSSYSGKLWACITNAYIVDISGGANATVSGGDTHQTVKNKPIATLTYTAKGGYQFKEFADITQNGITAKRTSETKVTVSGTPTGNVKITIPDAVEMPAATVDTAPAAADSLKYDGTEQTLIDNKGACTGGTMNYAVTTTATEPADSAYAAQDPKGKNAGKYYVWYKAKGDADHSDSAADKIEVSIAKRDVTLTSATKNKVYDGKALTDNIVAVSGDGFVQGEGADYTVTGTQTLPGESDNSFTYKLKEGTLAGNYEISTVVGKLKITDRNAEEPDKKYEITVKANSGTVKYNGNEQSLSGFETLNFTVNDVKYIVSGLTASAKGTDVGDYTVEVSGTPVVKDEAGHDLTNQFIVNTANGKFTISKRDVTMTSATQTREYNGKALTNEEVTVSGDGFVSGEGATYDVTGKQKLVGSSENTFTYVLNDRTKADNYNIITNPGMLTVTSRDAKYDIAPEANSEQFLYDGEEHSVTGLVTDTFTVEDETYTVSGLTVVGMGTDVGEYVVNVTGTAVVSDSEGNDVSSEFSVVPVAGKMNITKRSVKITSVTDEKAYDGTPLTNEKVNISGDGFAQGEGADYEFSGARTLVGDAENAFTYTLKEGTKAENYVIETEFGTLTVTTRTDDEDEATTGKYNITVKANSATVTYNGREQSVSGFETLEFKKNGQTFTVEGLSAEVKGLNVGVYNSIVIGTAVVKDAEGNDVTDNFRVKTENGKLTIKKLPAAPKVTTVAKTSARAMTVKWTMKWGKVNGAKNYKVAYRKVGSKKWTYKKTKKTQYVVKGHKMKGLYEYKVAAVSKKGSTWSNTSRRYFNGVKATAKAGKGAIKVSWKKVKGASGYQIQVATNKKMKNAKKYVVSKSANTYKVKGLKSGKKYYVKVRPLKNYKGKTYKGILCKPKAVTVK